MLKIAIPVENGGFCAHFGGAERFAVYEVNEESHAIVSRVSATAPPHEHGVFPRWLKEQDVDVVLAGGMGPRAVQIFQLLGIRTVLGIESGEPDQLVRAYLEGSLVASGEGCGGGGLHDCGEHQER
jgi:ATP-binding protein involved in chromosome partitioning